MNYGLYLAASGTLTGMHRMDVIANNLANVNTVGFKPDIVYQLERLPERLEGSQPVDSFSMLEMLGGGTLSDRTRVDLKQGAIQQTGNDLDLAIRGEGFFVVSTGHGEGDERLRLTRDGRFTLDAAGQLVQISTGLPVLDDRDLPIVLDRAATVRIDAGGAILQNNQPVARVQVTAVPDHSILSKTGDNLFRVNSNAQVSRQQAGSQVMQGHVEGSGVDPVIALKDLMNISKSVATSARIMQFHDSIMDQAINTFGRVA
jgi:flagellar basal body rod protein FlgG